MPLKIIRPDHMEIMGKGPVLLTATHATSPHADLHTGPILEDTALVAKCYAIIGKVSREYLDLNRIQSANSDFRAAIQTLLDEEGVKCILDIHGKRDPGVEIGTAIGETASESTTRIVEDILAKSFKVTLNQHYKGIELGSIVTTYNTKSATGQFSLEAVQIEFGEEERTLQREAIITSIALIVSALNHKLGFSMTEESTGNDLDKTNPGLGEESDSENETGGNP